jgi:hypothetical protein
MTNQELQNAKVPLMPHLENPETCFRVNQALEKRNYADYQCFQMLEKLLDNIPVTELAKFYSDLNSIDIDEAHEFLETCHAILKERRDSNEEFLRAVSGR